MGREVRRVPPDWVHPTDEKGSHIPMFSRTLAQRTADAVEWSEEPPDSSTYWPEFGDRATHFQIYEDVSEGTPISPVKATPEELARWLADTGA